MTVQDRYLSYPGSQREVFAPVAENLESYLTPSTVRMMTFEVNRLLRWTRPAEILNVGCGCGFHDVEMAKRRFVQRIDSLDHSSGSVAKANELFSDRKIVRSVTDFLRQKPCPQYDCVVSFQGIEALGNPEVFLRRCARWCKPGGCVAIYTANSMCSQIDWEKVPVQGNSVRNLLTPEQLQELGSKVGLTSRQVFTYQATPYRRPYWFHLWMGYWFSSRGERLATLFQKTSAT